MDEKLHILEMLEFGTITAAEAEALLDALEADASRPDAPADDITALLEECRTLQAECQALRDECRFLRNECQRYAAEAEDHASDAEDYASDAEDYADEAEDHASGSAPDLSGVYETLGEVQTILESLGIQGVDLSRARDSVKNAFKQTAPQNSPHRGGPLPHGFGLSSADRDAWYTRREADRKRREGDRKRREQDRLRRDGDRARRGEQYIADRNFTREVVITDPQADILDAISGTLFGYLDASLIIPSFYGELQGQVTGMSLSAPCRAEPVGSPSKTTGRATCSGR